MVNGMLDYLWLVPGLPLLGVILNAAIALFYERPLLLAEAAHGDQGHGDSHGGHHAPAPYRKLVSFIGPGVIGGAFVVAVLSVMALAARPAHDRFFIQVLFPWIESGSFSASAALQLDPLSSVMILVVTGVGFLIHVYSVGYMHGDPGYARFFTYLNLFMTSMLVLVLANNYLLLYVFWEGVGLCSYLLIGFWF